MIVNYAIEKKAQHDIDLGSEQLLMDDIDFDDMEMETDYESDD
jgi:hypothetical protein